MSCERCAQLERKVAQLEDDLEQAEEVRSLVVPDDGDWYEDAYDDLVDAVIDFDRGVIDRAELVGKVNRRWAVAR